MSAATSARALTAQLGAGAIPAGIQYPVADNVVCLAGTIAVSNGSGYCLSAPSGSGYVALGRFQATVDNTSAGPAGAGHANGALYAGVDQGVFCWNNSTAGDAITNANRGSVCYIADNQTVALTVAAASDSAANRALATAAIATYFAALDIAEDVDLGRTYAALYAAAGILDADLATSADVSINNGQIATPNVVLTWVVI
jgi:hypothetical protein